MGLLLRNSASGFHLGHGLKLQGEHDAADKKGDYGAASFWVKTKLLLAGVAVNWLVAAALLTVLAWAGLPKILPNQFVIPNDATISKEPVEIAAVTTDSPASKSGLKVGDQILRFAGEPVDTSAVLVEQSKAKKGQTVDIIYSRGGVESTTSVTLRSENNQGYLGVASGQREEIRTSWSAPVVGVMTAGQFTLATLQGLGNVIVNLVSGLVLQFSADSSIRTQAHQDLQTVSSSVAGPVGILGTIFPAAEQAGPIQLIFLTALISLTLAVMNVLPIPALDGGRWFTMAIFRLLKKPLTKEREERIQGTGFLILMLLVVVITVADVAKLLR